MNKIRWFFFFAFINFQEILPFSHILKYNKTLHIFQLMLFEKHLQLSNKFTVYDT